MEEGPDIKYANSIFYHAGGDGLVEYKLPELLLNHLEVFHVPVGHPAYPGRGVRAKAPIKQDQDVAYYAGIYRPGIVAPDNPYVFGVHPARLDMVIDALRCGNITRFINDPRGSGREPNIVADDMLIETRKAQLRTVVFRALCDIEVGQELLFPYEASVKGYWSSTSEVIDTESSTTPPFSPSFQPWSQRERWELLKKRKAHMLPKALLLKHL